MFTISLILFVIYLLLHLIDEFWFHRKSDFSRLEYLAQFFDIALILSCIGIVLFIEYSSSTQAIFGLAAALSFLTISKSELSRTRHCSPQERWLHSWIYMLHPLMLMTLAAIWPFINGVSFFMNMVIPFSTDYLKLLCQTYFGITVIFATYLLVYGLLLKKYPKDTSPAPELDQLETQ